MVDLVSEWEDGTERAAPRFRVVVLRPAARLRAAYYPETNPLVPLDSTAEGSNQPASKSVVVRLEPHDAERPAQGAPEVTSERRRLGAAAGDEQKRRRRARPPELTRRREPAMRAVSNPERRTRRARLRRIRRTRGVEVMAPREVPLGGPRAMPVRRTLPQRERSLIGAWCFVDHYGPDDVADTGGMSVAPHPHTGLQTVSWLFTGEIEHRDSAGTPRDGAARRAQPDDRRPRHQPLRGLHRPRPRCCTAPSCGWRCPTRPATATRLRPPRARSR